MTEYSTEPTAARVEREEPSVGRLIGELIEDGQTLVRKEIELARREVTGSIDKAKTGALALAIGGVVAAIGSLLLVLMTVQLLVARFNLEEWQGYMAVGIPLLIIGGVVIFIGTQSLREANPVPTETIESVRKDVEWIREQSQSDKT